MYRTQGRTSGYKKYMKQVDKHANTYGEYDYQGRIYDQRFSDVEDVIVQFYEGAQDSAQVEINKTNFPDGTFRAYVTREFDSNSDKVLSDAEIALATRIDARGMGIQSLQGIEYFAALEYLDC